MAGLVHTLQKCQCYERQRLKNSSRIKEIKETGKLNATYDPGLTPGLVMSTTSIFISLLL